MTEENKILRIGLADDHKLITDSLIEFLEKNIQCEISFVARNGKEVMQKLNEYKCDILILDINMPEMDGLQALDKIRKNHSNQKVIVLTMYDDEALLLKLVKLKINGYLSKSGSSTELLKAIKEVHDKGHYFSERLVDIMYNKTAGPNKIEHETQYVELDKTDIEILRLICFEYTSKEIGKELFLSPRTIEGRRKRMIRQLGVKNQAGLIIYSIKKGIIKI